MKKYELEIALSKENLKKTLVEDLKNFLFHCLLVLMITCFLVCFFQEIYDGFLWKRQLKTSILNLFSKIISVLYLWKICYRYFVIKKKIIERRMVRQVLIKLF